MKCNQCNHEDTKVIESREATDGEAIRRRRACPKCQARFTTYERIERPYLVVVKNDGSRELFNREKLLKGLYKACDKTPVSSIQIERLVSDIEKHLYNCNEQEIPTMKIGDLVMKRLAELNEVAYVRFASVYRRFKDIAGFEKELSQIKKLQSAEPVVKKDVDFKAG